MNARAKKGKPSTCRSTRRPKEVQAALEKLKSGEPKTAIGPGNVVVAGGYDPATETGTYTIEFTGALGGRYIGEEPLGLSSEITAHEETKFEKEQEKSGGDREPEEPEGEAEITTPGYHDTVDYQLVPDNRGDTAIFSPPAHPITILEKLPPGLTTVEMPRVELHSPERTGEGWSCRVPTGGLSEKELEQRQHEEEKRDREQKLPEGSGLSEVECTLVNFRQAEPRTGRQPGCSAPDASDRSERRYRSPAGGHEHRKQGPHRRRRSQARRNRRTGDGRAKPPKPRRWPGSGTVRGAGVQRPHDRGSRRNLHPGRRSPVRGHHQRVLQHRRPARPPTASPNRRS